MKKFLEEFKEFAGRGNMIDMAVGLIMGSAFSGLITALTDDFISPLLSIFMTGIDFSALSFKIGNGTFAIGSFITQVINFVITAFVLFLLVKGFNALRRPKTEEDKPATKICPFCQSEISAKATRCPHCTSLLSETPAADASDSAAAEKAKA